MVPVVWSFDVTVHAVFDAYMLFCVCDTVHLVLNMLVTVVYVVIMLELCYTQSGRRQINWHKFYGEQKATKSVQYF